MALKHVRRADYSLYRGEDYYSYRGEEVEEMKKNHLMIDSWNYNCLKLVFVEIPRMYSIELFLIELVAMYSRTFVDYFIYKGGGWWIMIFF